MIDRIRGHRILFYCKGGSQIGMGHFARCRMLLEKLAAPGSIVATKPDSSAMGMLESLGIAWQSVDTRLTGGGLGLAIAELAQKAGVKIVLLDCKDNSREFVAAIRQSGLLVVDLEDTGPGRLEADILVDPHIQPGSLEAAYNGRAECFFGPDWALISPEYAVLHREMEARNKTVDENSESLAITVSLGGSDPSGLTGKVIKLLNKVSPHVTVDVVLGPAAVGSGLLELSKSSVSIHRGLPGLYSLLHTSALALVSGGITMFESLSMGVPTVVVPQHEEQYVNASRLARRGALVVAPPPSDDGFEVGLEVVVREFMGDSALRQRIGETGFTLVDGLGTERLALRIDQMINHRNGKTRTTVADMGISGKEARIG